jgi:hypothetical protein
MNEQLEAILDTVFECGWEAGERYKEAKGGTTDVSDTLFKAKQDITALIQEAVKEGRVDELLYLANSADPLILDRTWIQNRIRELTNSGGSNNE